MNPIYHRRAGAALLLVLGLARGAGGVVLLRGGVSGLDAGVNPEAPAALLGSGLAVTGTLCVAFGVVIWRGLRNAWAWSLLPLGAFVLGGLVNGFALYGLPRPAGLLGNLAYAGLVVLLLRRGEPRTLGQA